MRSASWGIASLIALCWASPVTAQTYTSTTTDEVLIEAEAELPQTADPSAAVHQVPKERLQKAQARGEGLAAVIDTVVGARVLDLGGPGARQQLTLRGGAASQVLIVVDGVPLRTPFSQGFDLGLVHPETLASVELVRGGQGATLGDGAITGALLMRTREVGEVPLAALSLVSGSFGTLRLSGVVQSAALTVAATFEDTDADFDYTSRLPGLEDLPGKRLNNDSRRITLSGGTRADLGGGSLQFRVGGAFREGGAPGLDSSPGASLVARTRTQHLRANGAWTRSMDWAQGAELQLSAYAAGIDLGFRDPDSDLKTDLRFLSTGTDASVTIGLSDAHLLTAAFTAALEDVQDTQDAPYPSRARMGVALSDEWSFDSAVLFAALRAAYVQGQGLTILPRLGMHWDLGEHIGLGLALGRSLRTPTLDDLYHPEESAYVGNPELGPERSWEAEMNAGYTAERWALKVAAFARTIDNAILYLNRNAFVVRPENVGAARALGVELEAATKTEVGPVRLDLTGQGSLLASDLVETGDRLPTQPAWSFAIEGSAHYRGAYVDSGLRGFGSTTVNLRSTAGNRVPAYLRWDVGAGATVSENLRLGLQILNLLDARTLVSVNRFPLPGRSVFISLRLSAGPSAQSTGARSISK